MSWFVLGVLLALHVFRDRWPSGCPDASAAPSRSGARTVSTTPRQPGWSESSTRSQSRIFAPCHQRWDSLRSCRRISRCLRVTCTTELPGPLPGGGFGVFISSHGDGGQPRYPHGISRWSLRLIWRARAFR